MVHPDTGDNIINPMLVQAIHYLQINNILSILKGPKKNISKLEFYIHTHKLIKRSKTSESMRILRIMLNYVGTISDNSNWFDLYWLGSYYCKEYDQYIKFIIDCHDERYNKKPLDPEDLPYYIQEVPPLEIEGLVFYSLKKYLEQFTKIKNKNSIELYQIYNINKMLLNNLIKDLVLIIWNYC